MRTTRITWYAVDEKPLPRESDMFLMWLRCSTIPESAWWCANKQVFVVSPNNELQREHELSEVAWWAPLPTLDDIRDPSHAGPVRHS